ncbi:MAG: imelysin family protein, partial [Bacteroidota bacterium]
ADEFNRPDLLTNVSNNIILPAHANFSAATTSLKQKKDAFISNPSSVTLDSLKYAFNAAYLVYMQVETYSFMPSEGIKNLNVFPTDTGQVGTNISTGTYNLDAANNIRAKGFPAIDYLLFSQDESEVIALFTVDANAANRKQFLNDIINEIETVASNASTAWNSYQAQFISASGTDIGSSVGMLVNDLSFQLERCRRERVGVPLGYIGLINSGTTVSKSVEAYYSTYSKELLIENLRNCKVLYTGGSGTGFDDYLEYLNAAYKDGLLSDTITHQFNIAIQKAQAMPVDFSTAVTTNKTEMESLFIELRKLTVLVKVDMSSQLGIIINYSDNDGD